MECEDKHPAPSEGAGINNVYWCSKDVYFVSGTVYPLAEPDRIGYYFYVARRV